MATLYKFKAYYTKLGVGAAPSSAPVATVVDTDAGTKLADAQATTTLANLVGYYEYEYSGADDLDLVCLFHTTDTTTDQQSLVSYVVDKVYQSKAKLVVIEGIVNSILADTGTDGVVLKAAGLSADAVVEIQSGLATTQHVQEVEDKIDIIDGVVDAVKAKTDMITTGITVLTIASPVIGSTITAIRGDTLVAVLEGIGSLVGYSNLWFTVKDDEADPDTASLIQIDTTYGLRYINGAAASDPENGSVTVTDEASGDVTIKLEAIETAQLSPRSYHYDIQVMDSTYVIKTLITGTFNVSPDYTRTYAWD